MHEKIQEFLKGQSYREFTNLDEGYSHLKNNEQTIVLYNPHNDEDLKFSIGEGELTLSFGGWTGSYQPSEEGCQLMLMDARNIMNDDSYVWSVKADGKQMVGLVNDSDTLFVDLAKNGMQVLGLLHQDLTLAKSLQQEFVFWDPKAIDPQPSLYLS